MKTLLLIRHAKSSWNDFSLSDFDRPLNTRGKSDAPEMARRLVARQIQIDLLLASPAVRAKTTAELFADALGNDTLKIQYDPNLYLPTPEIIQQTITSMEDAYQTIALFSHNPGITDFANSLIDQVHVDDMPTCSVFGLQIDTIHWKQFQTASKSFLFFDFPKSIHR